MLWQVLVRSRLGLGQSAWGYPSLPSATLTGRFLVRYQLGLGIRRGAKQESTEMCQVNLTPTTDQLLAAARVFARFFPEFTPIPTSFSRFYSKKIEHLQKKQRISAKKCDFFTILLDI